MAESDHVQDTERLLAAVASGNQMALDSLLGLHRGYLKRVVVHRIDPMLRSRVDPSDVVQEVLVDVSQRIHEYVERKPISFRLWIRRKAIDILTDQERRHLRAQKRSVWREQPITEVSSVAIAEKLMAPRQSSASKPELSHRFQQALDRLSASDQEMLMLRYAEELNNAEVAELLDLEPETARKRHGRAIQRLYQHLIDLKYSPLPPQR